jgi:hypothetical protein
MAQTMIASKMTDGQIENAVDKLRCALRKHREEITSETAQLALGVGNIGVLMFAPFQSRAEVLSDMIVRHVTVNRNRNPQEMLNATGRRQYTNSDIVNSMPHGEGDETDVYFFKMNRYISDYDLEREYELRGLKPDPYAQDAVNEIDPSFADTKPNGTHWKGSDGKWYYVAFRQWRGGESGVAVGRDVGDWGGDWWFGGVRK